MQVNYFHPPTFGMTVPLFTEKFYGAKGRLFQQNSTFDRLYLLGKEDHSKSSRVDNLNLHPKHIY